MWHDFLKCLGRLSLAFHQETLVYFKESGSTTCIKQQKGQIMSTL